jgi:hypothetical protein
VTLRLTLSKAFKAPQSSQTGEPSSLQRTKILPPGEPPVVDWCAVADSFFYDEYNKPEDQRHQGVFHPSAGLVPEMGNCERAILFDLLCAKRGRQAKSPQLIKILEFGTDQHKRFSDFFQKAADKARRDGIKRSFLKMAKSHYMGITQVETDVPAKHPTHCIEGEADARVTFSSGWSYVLDLKTMNNKTWSATFEPSLRYRVQLNTYMGILGDRIGAIIPENKDNQKWLSHTVRFDPGMFEATENYCRFLLQMLKDGDFPAFEEKVCKNSITFCSYVTECEAHRQGKHLADIDNRSPELKRRHLKVL